MSKISHFTFPVVDTNGNIFFEGDPVSPVGEQVGAVNAATVYTPSANQEVILDAAPNNK
jgi:hypothetical protein